MHKMERRLDIRGYRKLIPWSIENKETENQIHRMKKLRMATAPNMHRTYREGRKFSGGG